MEDITWTTAAEFVLYVEAWEGVKTPMKRARFTTIIEGTESISGVNSVHLPAINHDNEHL